MAKVSRAREKKALVIERLSEILAKSSLGILTDYRGLSASEINDLRRKLRESGIDYKVVKNTLTRLAAERVGKGGLGSLLRGPVAIAFSYGGVVEPAKILTDYTRTAKTSLNIKGGFLGDRILTPEDVTTLATLPTREVLLAKIMGGMQSPILALLNCLTSPMSGLVGVLQARIKQMEGAQNVSR